MVVTPKLTDPELAMLRELIGKITSGPWTAQGKVVQATRYTDGLGIPVLVACPGMAGQIESEQDANARFIAAARTALPRLLDEVEEHRARWRDTALEPPKNGEIVLVHGGVAQYRNGEFYTGMETPQYARPIQWEVTHWMRLPTPQARAAIKEAKGEPAR